MNKENIKWDGKALETLFEALSKTVKYESFYDDKAPYNGSEWSDAESSNPRSVLQDGIKAKAETIEKELLKIQPRDTSDCLNKNKIYTAMEQFLFHSGEMGVFALCIEDSRWATGTYYSTLLNEMICKNHAVKGIGETYYDDSTHSTFMACDVDSEYVWLSAVDFYNAYKEIHVFIDYKDLEKAELSVLEEITEEQWYEDAKYTDMLYEDEMARQCPNDYDTNKK